ncbi:hypothetical protein RintRC_0458 [Richelia intracellularis]|nr:hypothetical protein RintRC_0458 [Richelia intracellularis]
MAQTLAVGRDFRGFTSKNIGDWTRKKVKKLELWRGGRVFFRLERAVLMVFLTVGKERFFLYTLLLKAQECLYPINRTTPANGSETDQVIPLLDSVKVKTNKRGRPRKSLKVKVLTADKAYVRF